MNSNLEDYGSRYYKDIIEISILWGYDYIKLQKYIKDTLRNVWL